MKAVILTRVSSKEQEEGHSLAAQNTLLIDYAHKKQLNVIKSFQIIESSTQGDRKKFKEVLSFCEAQNEPIALIAASVDRIQRSFKDSVLLDKLVKEEKIVLHFWRENMIIGKGASAMDIMRWDYAVMGAKSYVLQLAENVKRSLDYKVNKGERTGVAPTGYINFKGDDGKNSIKPHEIDGAKVKQLFDLYSLGGTSVHELVRIAEEMGLRSRTGSHLSASSITYILTNPFYYGEMLVKGQLRTHVYQPLVSREVWDKCQNQHEKTSQKKQVKYSEKPYVYRGLITCANTGKVCTWDTKKGKFVYLIAYDEDGNRDYVKKQEIDEQIEYVLRSIKVPKETLSALQQHLSSSKASEIAYRDREIADLKASLTKTQGRLDKLFQMRLDDEIDKETYELKRNDLQLDRDRINAKIKSHGVADDGFNETLLQLFDIANNSWAIFRRTKNLSAARMLLQFIIKRMEIKDHHIGYELNFPFSAFQDMGQADSCELGGNGGNTGGSSGSDGKSGTSSVAFCELKKTDKKQGLTTEIASPVQSGCPDCSVFQLRRAEIIQLKEQLAVVLSALAA